MFTLKSRQLSYQKASLSDATRRARKFQVKTYRRFCRLYSLPAFPCSAHQACLYITYLAKKLAPSSVSNYMSAVWTHQRCIGMSTHELDYKVHSTIRGVARLERRRKLIKYAITPADLLAMYKHINIVNPSDLIFWGALTLSFRALLRKSHVTPSPHSLRAEDIVFKEDYIIVTLRTSKTDQFGRSPVVVTVKSIPGSPLCPVSMLRRIFSLRNPGPKDPVFTVRSCVGLKPMSYSAYNNKLKLIAGKSGLDPKLVSTHSIRHGGATYLQSINMPLDSIKARGNWRSSCVNNYLHPSVAYKLSKDDLVVKDLLTYI